MSKKASKRPKRSDAPSTWAAIGGKDVRNGLTRERIVSAGIEIADTQGLPAVSIRNVAAQLNSSAMALYHYIPAKRDLLNLMLDASYAEFEWSAENADSWRDVLRQFAWESRRCLKRHPWVSILRAGDPEYGPECIRTLEALLTGLSRFGLGVRTALRVLGVLFVFVNGFVAVENPGMDTGRTHAQRRSAGRPPTFSRPVLATGKFPRVSRFVDQGAELPDDKSFDRALNWILNGMASDIESCIRSTDADAKESVLTSKKRVS